MSQQKNTTQNSQAVFVGNLTEAWIKTRRINHLSQQCEKERMN